MKLSCMKISFRISSSNKLMDFLFVLLMPRSYVRKPSMLLGGVRGRKYLLHSASK